MDNHLPHLSGIVVGVDGSVHSTQAATIAATMAAAEHRTLHLVHAIAPLDAYYWIRTPAGVGYESPLHKGASAELTALTHLLREQHPELTVDSHIVLGDARDILSDLSEDAHLVVVGTRGRGMFGPSHVGSVALHLTRHALCPVMVVRPGEHAPEGNGVVAGIDDTERSLPVLEHAFDAASRQGASLTILHSDWLLGPVVSEAGFVPVLDTDEDEVRRLVAEESAGLREKYPDVPVDVVVGHHSAEIELLKHAEGKDLIVVGARSHGAVGEFLLQSVATQVVQQASCPVVVVPNRRR